MNPDEKLREILVRKCLPYVVLEEGSMHSTVAEKCLDYVYHQLEYLDWKFDPADDLVFYKKTLLGVLRQNPGLFEEAQQEFQNYLYPLFQKMIHDFQKAISECEVLDKTPDFLMLCLEHKSLLGDNRRGLYLFGYEVRNPVYEIHPKSLVICIKDRYVVEVDSLGEQGKICA